MTTPNSYLPGESVRFSCSPTILNIDGSRSPVDVPGLTLTVYGPDRTKIVVSSPAHDSTGNYHGDVVLPLTARPGRWSAIWSASGGTPATSGTGQSLFIVEELLTNP